MYLLVYAWCMIFPVSFTYRVELHRETKIEGETFQLDCQLGVSDLQGLQIVNAQNESVSLIAPVTVKDSQRSCDIMVQAKVDYQYNFSCDAEDAVLRLRIDNVSNKDHGTTFKCNTRTGLNMTSLEVKVPLKFVIMNQTTDKQLIVVTKKQITILCETSPSRPNGTIRWYIQSTEINENGLIETEYISTKGNLTVTKSTLSYHGQQYDNGKTLYCTAENGFDHKRSNDVLLNILYGPTKINLYPETLVPIIGFNSIPVNCSADCNPPCNIHWLKNDQTFTSTQVLNLGVGSANSEGIYKCFADNDYNRTSRDLNVTVLYGPGDSLMLDVNTTDIVITEEMELNVTCIASCDPECDIRWTLNYSETVNKNVLAVHDFIKYLPSDFTCSAQNVYGAANITITADYNYSPRNITLDLLTTALTLTDDDTVPDITCNADCRPLCNYTWLHDGNHFKNGATLSLGKAKPNTTGSFTCLASNKGGQLTSSMYILVQGVWLQKRHLSCPSGNQTDINLRCNAENLPANSTLVTWQHLYHNQHVRYQTGVTTGNVNVLMIPFCGYMDTGTYICEAKYMGQLEGEKISKATAQVEVHDKPVISSYKNISISPDKSTLNITVKYYSVPTPTNTLWYKDGEELVLTDRRRQLTYPTKLNLTFYQNVICVDGFESKLVIIKPVSSDRGKYTLVIINARGIAKQFVEINDFKLGVMEYGLMSGGTVLLVTLPVICGLCCYYRRNKDNVPKRKRQISNRRCAQTVGSNLYESINQVGQIRLSVSRLFFSLLRRENGYFEPVVDMNPMTTSERHEIKEHTDTDEIYSRIDEDI